MLTTVEGVYRKGRIELAETPAAVSDARVAELEREIDEKLARLYGL